MYLDDIKWSPNEKKIARAAYDKAYEREMTEIKNILREKSAAIKENQDVWSIHDFLSQRRSSVDRRYDYRYSKLLIVFCGLLADGYVTEEDLYGLSEEKLKIIKAEWQTE